MLWIILNTVLWIVNDFWSYPRKPASSLSLAEYNLLWMPQQRFWLRKDLSIRAARFIFMIAGADFHTALPRLRDQINLCLAGVIHFLIFTVTIMNCLFSYWTHVHNPYIILRRISPILATELHLQEFRRH